MESVAEYLAGRRGHAERARPLDRHARWFFPGLFVLAVLVLSVRVFAF
ncbi:MAG: hypothetical protein HY727_21765 [Candidatus Rokubacteria bacterium]|nr:hypothetical protein [Candidatus Rokubacteria bacterium]